MQLFEAARPETYRLGEADLVVRTTGSGPPMLLVHGFPIHGFTWRDLLPRLSARFTCIMPDQPGLGSSGWDGRADLSLPAQAARLAALVDRLDLRNVTVVGHDSGAIVARLLALARPDRVVRLALLNTDMPGHRPPWVPLYQRMARLPGARYAFRASFQQGWFLRSSMGFGAFYTNKALLDRPEVMDAYVRPLATSLAAVDGALAYLRSVEWSVLDGLREKHRDIKADVLILWGEDDPTFPVALAELMAGQFRHEPKFVRIAGASLLPHEEKPDIVGEQLLHFAAAS